MLRISKLADYGTAVMAYLAKHETSLCNAREIAQHTHLTMATVSKLLKYLTNAALLRSVRGVNGGYCLQRAASEISIADIIYALEEQRGLIECRVQPNNCILQQVCKIKGNWQLISKAIEIALDSVSLEALARPQLNVYEIQDLVIEAFRPSAGAR